MASGSLGGVGLIRLTTSNLSPLVLKFHSVVQSFGQVSPSNGIKVQTRPSPIPDIFLPLESKKDAAKGHSSSTFFVISYSQFEISVVSSIKSIVASHVGQFMILKIRSDSIDTSLY